LDEDRRRVIELMKRQGAYTVEEAIATFSLIKQEAFRVWNDHRESPQVRAMALREAREAEVELDHITGLTDSRGGVGVHVGVQMAEQKVTFLDPENPALRAALLILHGEESKRITDGTNGEDQ